MSLDVWLMLENGDPVHEPVPRIFIRRDGRQMEISRAEWDELNPEREPVTTMATTEGEVFSANITHNLGGMADQCGLYTPMWRPEELGITRAEQLIEPLEAGLKCLRLKRDELQAFNPKNGWGDYEGLVEFTESYLIACCKWPQAEVKTWR